MPLYMICSTSISMAPMSKSEHTKLITQAPAADPTIARAAGPLTFVLSSFEGSLDPVSATKAATCREGVRGAVPARSFNRMQGRSARKSKVERDAQHPNNARADQERDVSSRPTPVPRMLLKVQQLMRS